MQRVAWSCLILLAAAASAVAAPADDAPLAAALFPAPQIASELASLRDVTAADLDGDGLPDFIGVGIDEAGAGLVEVRLALPAGDYGALVTYPAGQGSSAVEAGDLDGDGDTDVVVTNHTSDDVTILYGTGNGRLAHRLTIPVGKGPAHPALADLDASGSLDLVLSHFTADFVSVLLGQGDGSFAPAVGYRTAFDPREVLPHDLDGDGDLDLAVACDNGGVISILLGCGDGTFRTLLPYPFAGGSGPNELGAGDLDDDGDVDLVVTFRHSAQIGVLLGAGDGTFELADPIFTETAYDDFQLADLDHDGRLDMVTLARQEDRLVILRGLPEARFEEVQSHLLEENSSSICVADLDLDDDLDVLVGRRSQPKFPSDDGEATIVRGTPSGRFVPPVVLAPDAAVRAVALAELTGDAHPDAVGVLDGEEALRVWPGDGQGGFGEPLLVSTGFKFHTDVLAEDMDLDGRRDLVVSSSTGDRVTVVLATGPGQFGAPLETLVGFFFAPFTPVVADFDEDGWPDVPVANADLDGVAFLYGTGGGALADPVTLPAGLAADGLAAGDLDGDGVLDLLATSSADELGAVLLGVGGGDFVAGPVFALEGAPRSPQLGDLDGDGALDLVVALPGHPALPPSEIGVLPGLGDGSFRAPTAFLSGDRVRGLAIGDGDGDGIPDLIAGSFTETGAWIYLNALGE